MAERTACVERNTLETQVKVSINLDGTGKARFAIGVPFLEHMLDQIARHGLFDLDIECNGDLHIDDHHTVEDAVVGGFDVDLFQEFFQGFVNHALVSLHIDNLRGTNTHHQIETVFKAFGRALRMASELDPRMAGQMPSTKGCL